MAMEQQRWTIRQVKTAGGFIKWGYVLRDGRRSATTWASAKEARRAAERASKEKTS
jgi:hypothetical protein